MLHDLFKNPMIFSMPKPFSLRLFALSASSMLSLGVATALLLLSTPARSADTAAPASTPAPAAAAVAVAPQPETPMPTAATPLASAEVSAPRYSASNLALAFNYMDANRDRKVSREEAASFRGVARNFDRADTDHDNALSRGEFDRAMNYVKPK
jgi:hypothetical protein